VSIGKNARTGIIAAIVAFSVLAGTVTSYAYWSATAQASLGNGAATLATTATGWATTTLGNENVSATSSNSLTATGSVTITNTTSTTSTQSQALSATFSRASGSTALATATTLTVWTVASAASCTPAAIPSGPTSGTWNAGVTVTATLAPGASIVYCLRNTVADRQNADDPSGTLTFTPQVASTLSISNFTNTTATTSTISTQYIYPLADFTSGYWYYITRATNWCWDVSGSGTGSPSALISYACKNNTDTNQDFRFMDADGDGYGDFQARHTTALRVEAAASTTSGSAVDMRTAATTTAVQQWQPQLVAAGTYQFVNKYSGLCLSMPAVSTGAATQVTCNGGADQKFTLTKRGVIGITNFACVNAGTNANRTVTYSWTQDYAGGPYLIQARQNGSSPFQTIATSSSASATSVTVAAPIGAPLTTWGGSLFGTTYTVQIVNDDAEVVGTGQIVVYNNLTYNYARCT
jgi:hypothetical protein